MLNIAIRCMRMIRLHVIQTKTTEIFYSLLRKVTMCDQREM